MHGYDVTDHYKVNNLFGTESDVEDLINACHAKGIKIIFDFVPNHVSSKHPWFEASAKETEKNTWFLWNSVKLAWNPMGSTNTWHQYGNRYYYGAFNGSMPDLNYRNAEVREEMKNVVRYWLNKGFDGIRVDAVRYLVEYSSLYIDTADSHDWYKELRSVLNEYNSPKFMVCEAWVENDRTRLDRYF
jgi:alpha-glucosidase